MLAVFSDNRQRGFENLHAKDKVRLRNPHTGELLHMSGQGITCSTTWSWLGFRHQAETLRARALARGEDWPFTIIHRNLTQDAPDETPDHIPEFEE